MTSKTIPEFRLVADLGGTNLRAVVAINGAIDERRVCKTTVGSAVEAQNIYEKCMRDAGLAGPIEAVIAAAGPIMGDEITLTNGGWSFRVSELKRKFGFAKVAVVNDTAAIALSVPHLRIHARRALGGGPADPEGPIAVVAAGTGLGVAGLLPSTNAALVLPGEAGHSTIESRR